MTYLPKLETIAKYTTGVRRSENPKTIQSRELRFGYLQKGLTTKGKPFKDPKRAKLNLEKAKRNIMISGNNMLELILAACDDACLEGKIPQILAAHPAGRVRIIIAKENTDCVMSAVCGHIPVRDEFGVKLFKAIEYTATTLDSSQLFTLHTPKGSNARVLVRFIIIAEKLQILF